MKIEIHMEHLKEVMLFTAQKFDIPEKEIRNDWGIDYNTNIDDELNKAAFLLSQSTFLIKQALPKDDGATLVYAFFYAFHAIQDLSDYCAYIYEDLFRLRHSEEFKNKHLDTPANFIVPDHYGYFLK